MATTDWSAYTTEEGIDLIALWKEETYMGGLTDRQLSEGAGFLRRVMEYEPIKSPEVGAVALAMADVLASRAGGI